MTTRGCPRLLQKQTSACSIFFGICASGAWYTGCCDSLDDSLVLGKVVISDREIQQWWDAPPMRAISDYALPAVSSRTDRETADRLKQGEFRPGSRYEWREIGVPPPWQANPEGSNTWDFFRQGLTWLKPLVNTWQADADDAAFTLTIETIRSWAGEFGTPDPSQMAWTDHAASVRLRFLLWFCEFYRTDIEVRDKATSRILLQLLVTHARFIQSGHTFNPRSNHGLDQIDTMLAAAIALSWWREADSWRTTANERMRLYLAENFSNHFFHLEQSPGYHEYVMRRLYETGRMLTENGVEANDALRETATRLAGLMPFLLYPDGTFPPLGDTSPLDGRKGLRVAFPVSGWAPVFPDDIAANPRDDASRFLWCEESGYAVFCGDDPAEMRDPDAGYAIFRLRAFPFTHYQHDALTFVYFANGRAWITDPGNYNYEEETALRKYVRSSGGHNVVLVDEQWHTLGEIDVKDWGRTATDDFATSTHHLSAVTHTREFRFRPNEFIEIHDTLIANDNRSHLYSQLLHLSPDVTVEIVDAQHATIISPDGRRCGVEQIGDAGAWRIVTGGSDGGIQGWVSLKFGTITEAPVLVYDLVGKDVAFHTRIAASTP